MKTGSRACTRTLLAAVLAFTSLNAGAQLPVIFDNGQTHSLAPYLETLQKEPETSRPETPAIPSPGAGDLRTLLPIRSPGLSPGKVQAQSHARPLLRPFFLIGADARSRRWLARNRAHLLSIGAIGMLVAADSEAQLRQIAALARGLSITPASGADLARVLDIKHYPVLITASGLSQ